MHLLLYIKTHILARQHWEAIGVKQWLCTNHTNIDYSLILFLFFCHQKKKSNITWVRPSTLDEWN